MRCSTFPVSGVRWIVPPRVACNNGQQIIRGGPVPVMYRVRINQKVGVKRSIINSQLQQKPLPPLCFM